ncbi:MAG TPA: DUF2946 family protein [Xanthobacteraceae bacterium]|jgi:hypothetical protein
MRHPRLGRRLVALVAAYGLALQVLLSGFVTASPAGAIICTADHAGAAAGAVDTNPFHLPGHPDACAVCALACGAAAPAPSGDAGIAPMQAAAEAVPAPRPAAAVRHAMVRAGLARAPPV